MYIEATVASKLSHGTANRVDDQNRSIVIVVFLYLCCMVVLDIVTLARYTARAVIIEYIEKLYWHCFVWIRSFWHKLK